MQVCCTLELINVKACRYECMFPFRYDNQGGSSMTAVKLSDQRGTGGGRSDRRCTIAAIKDEALGTNGQPAYVQVNTMLEISLLSLFACRGVSGKPSSTMSLQSKGDNLFFLSSILHMRTFSDAEASPGIIHPDITCHYQANSLISQAESERSSFHFPADLLLRDHDQAGEHVLSCLSLELQWQDVQQEAVRPFWGWSVVLREVRPGSSTRLALRSAAAS